MVYRYL